MTKYLTPIRARFQLLILLPIPMTFAGFQPFTLIDYPGVISANVFTQGCVFRCAYCHNPELIPLKGSRPTITEEEIFARLRKHKNMLEGVCITGGEPTIHPDLPDFIRTLKKERFLVKLDTNGVNPRMVKQLIDERLVDYLAMDLKHVWEKYDQVTRAENPQVTENCQETFELIQQSPVRHEFRTTVYSGMHTEEEIVRIGEQLRQGERYAIQPIRYGTTLDAGLKILPSINTNLIVEQLMTLRPDLDVVVRS